MAGRPWELVVVVRGFESKHSALDEVKQRVQQIDESSAELRTKISQSKAQRKSILQSYREEIAVLRALQQEQKSGAAQIEEMAKNLQRMKAVMLHFAHLVRSKELKQSIATERAKDCNREQAKGREAETG